jgi:RNA-binding protein YlmH
MAHYIKDNVTKISRVGVAVERVSLDNISTKTDDLTLKSATAASKRLDVVVGAGFNMSQTRVSELIAAGVVSVNHVARTLKSKSKAVRLFLLKGSGV